MVVYLNTSNTKTAAWLHGDDQEEDTLVLSYAVGGFTLGYQWSEEETGKFKYY